MMPSATIKFDCPECRRLVSFTRKKLEDGRCGACGHSLSADDQERINSALLEIEGKQLLDIFER
jgi:transcription initiation factor IIE alpha subunit